MAEVEEVTLLEKMVVEEVMMERMEGVREVDTEGKKMEKNEGYIEGEIGGGR